jgi:LAO/AO transport system kinase
MVQRMGAPRADIEALHRDFAAGRKVALSRAISLVENEQPGFRELLRRLLPLLGRAHRIGITGPPGAGKSTICSALVRFYRERGEKVAVVAVDPTSPFTGGALLGDRIRMNELSLDPGVFIRSMASRGSVGGLALATGEVTDVIDAFGFDRILIETMGVGQSELDVTAAADTTVVLLVPESGDSIQAMKAGLLEAADLFVVNKADRPGAERMARELSMMLHLRMGKTLRNVPAHHGVDLRRVQAPAAPPLREDAKPASWDPPVLQTVAETGRGIPELAQSLDAHRSWLDTSGERQRRRRNRLAERVRDEVERRFRHRLWKDLQALDLIEDAMPQLEQGSMSPYDLARTILQRANAAPESDAD